MRAIPKSRDPNWNVFLSVPRSVARWRNLTSCIFAFALPVANVVVVDVVVVNEDASMMTRAVAVEVNWSCAHNVDVGEVDEMVGVK